MLTQIVISNLALIKSASIEIYKGTTVITGDTGAGKSLLIDAIELALGKRIDTEKVRQGEKKADVSLTFNLTNLFNAQQWLNHHELADESGECIIRRTVFKDGRSRSFINETPVTLTLLRELTEQLINVHGQHEHQALFKQDFQRQMLDQFAGHESLVDQVASAAKAWQQISNEIHSLKNQHDDTESRSAFLKFQLAELTECKLQPNEYDELDKEHQLLSSSTEIIQKLSDSMRLLNDEESQDLVSGVKRLQHNISDITLTHPKIDEWQETLNNVLIQLNDLEDEFKNFLDHLELDPERLNYVEARISTLFTLARKHKLQPNMLLSFQEKLAAELITLDQKDEKITALQLALEKVALDYQTLAKKLSVSRDKAALRLTKEINAYLKTLAMPKGQFKIEFSSESPFSSHGQEKVLFQIAMNAGQSFLPLAKVASGGELSRIGLAIHMATAEQHTIPTLIFDEVDVGISGGIAEIVGKIIRQVGEAHQVICITHLPQVAALAHHHLRVTKTHLTDETYSSVEALNTQGKINELARLLGGVEVTKKTLSVAKEMLDKVPG